MPHRTYQDPETAWRAPAFWDNLPHIYLSSDALREAARRYLQPPLPEASYPETEVADILASYTPQDLQKLRRFSRQGGPDLYDLKDCSFPATYSGSMDPPESGKRTGTTGRRLTTERRLTTYSPNFLKHLKQHHVYPAGYEFTDGRQLDEPANMRAIDAMVSQERPSMPEISEEEYKKFTRDAKRIPLEQTDKDWSKVFTRWFEMREDSDSACQAGFLFSNFAPLTDGTMALAKPRLFAGARREALDPDICAALHDLIEPAVCHHLIAPNFFCEVKPTESSSQVNLAGRACYEGAFGARAMQALRAYNLQEGPVCDNNAYTITATFREGILRLYAHHVQGGNPRSYVMTLIDEYYILAGRGVLLEAIRAYRNARDWAKQQRDELIMAANARKLPQLNPLPAGPSGTAGEDDAVPDGLEAEKAQPPTTPAAASETSAQGNIHRGKKRPTEGGETGHSKKARSRSSVGSGSQ